jgi:8-oxo-dGTP diphosphatase
MSEKHPRVGVSVLITYEKRGIVYVLFGKRKGSHGAGDWAPPGGHLEFGESLAECACREVMEETGIKLDPERIERAPMQYTNDIFKTESKHYITLFFVAKLDERAEVKLLEPDKCEEWRWVPFTEEGLPEPAFLPMLNWHMPGEDQLAEDGY